MKCNFFLGILPISLDRQPMRSNVECEANVALETDNIYEKILKDPQKTEEYWWKPVNLKT